MKNIFKIIIAIFVFGSCTDIVVQKQPGKPLSEFPNFLLGEFEFRYPNQIQSMIPAFDSLGLSNKIIVRFDKKSMTMIDKVNESRTNINDTIAVCKIGGDHYFCLGKAPKIHVLKISQNESNIEIFPMYIDGEVSDNELKKYFKKVERSTFSESVNGEFNVEIDPKKLKSYFESQYPSKDPYVLIRR